MRNHPCFLRKASLRAEFGRFLCQWKYDISAISYILSCTLLQIKRMENFYCTVVPLDISGAMASTFFRNFGSSAPAARLIELLPADAGIVLHYLGTGAGSTRIHRDHGFISEFIPVARLPLLRFVLMDHPRESKPIEPSIGIQG
jgi:hypothetical protein